MSALLISIASLSFRPTPRRTPPHTTQLHTDPMRQPKDQTHLQNLGRQSHGSLNPQVLRLGSLQQLSADLLEGCDLSRGQGDSDLVDFLYASRQCQLLFLSFLLYFLIFYGRGCAQTHRDKGMISMEWNVLVLHRRSPSLAFGKTWWLSESVEDDSGYVVLVLVCECKCHSRPERFVRFGNVMRGFGLGGVIEKSG